MGYSATAYTIIGYKLKKAECETRTEVPGCRCELSEKERREFKFCPKCGKKAMQVREEYIFEDNSFPEGFEMEGEGDLKYSIRENYDAGIVYVGIVKSQGAYDHDCFINMDELSKLDFVRMENYLKERLAELGINVNAKNFGMHTFLYESY